MILIVDDNASIREMQTAILQSAGFSVREAADGKEALRLVQDQCPKLILMDITMPGMTGYQVLAKLREQYGDKLPIVLVSALPEEEERETALSRGATDYISKPFDIPSVIRSVKQYLPDSSVA